MYEDSWYSFAPNVQASNGHEQSQKIGHRRRESLLKQSNEYDSGVNLKSDPMSSLNEEISTTRNPPLATLVKRAKSYSDFYHVVRSHITRDARAIKKKEKNVEAAKRTKRGLLDFECQFDSNEEALIGASHGEFEVYQNQLSLTERHLDGLLTDTLSALDMLAILSESFKAVDAETTAFQSQCEDLLDEQKRLKNLGDNIGERLSYYSFLEPITRRLNAPGASAVIGDDSIAEILSTLDACILYMNRHRSDREAETYLSRYESLLTRVLNLIGIRLRDTIGNSSSKAKERALEGVTNMTNAYIIQVASTTADDNFLEKTMKLLVSQATKSKYGIARKGNLDDLPWLSDSYKTCFVDLQESYFRSRNTFVPILMSKLISREIRATPEPLKDVVRLSRECMKIAVEICMTECNQYDSFFYIRDENLELVRGSPFSSFSLYRRNDDDPVNDYLKTLCEKTIKEFLEPYLRASEPNSLIQICLWLRSECDDLIAPNGELMEFLEPSAPNTESHANREVLRLNNNKAKLYLIMECEVIKLGQLRLTEIRQREIDQYPRKNLKDLLPAGDLKSRTSKGKGKEETGEGLEPDVLLLGVEDIAARALGQGYYSAFPPLKTTIRILIVHRDLVNIMLEDSINTGSFVWEVITSGCKAVTECSHNITETVDRQLFVIKNLLLLKGLLQQLEISGTKKVTQINWNGLTFDWGSGVRGSLFDADLYRYTSWASSAFPKVEEKSEDATILLDAELREHIHSFQSHAARRIRDEKTAKLRKDAASNREAIQRRLYAVFAHERWLVEQLWRSVKETFTYNLKIEPAEESIYQQLIRLSDPLEWADAPKSPAIGNGSKN